MRLDSVPSKSKMTALIIDRFRLLDDLLALALKLRSFHHDDGAAAFALDLDIDTHADDLPVMGFAAGMILLHLHDIV